MAYRKKYIRKKYQKEDPLERILALSVVLLGLWGFWIYQNFIKENIDIVSFYAKIVFCVFILLIIVFCVFKIRKILKNRNIERERINNIPLFLRDLESKIREFKPSQYYKEEKFYQVELIGFLKNNYPNSKIEESRDYKRPDITIDDIAIEIKGPTRMSCLKTLPDKINSYLPTWNYLFFVLFNIEIHSDKQQNQRIYLEKKQQILENTIDSKKNKIFFIEI